MSRIDLTLLIGIVLVGLISVGVLFLPFLVSGATTTDKIIVPTPPPSPKLYNDLPVITDVPITTYKDLFEDLTLRTDNSLTYYDFKNDVYISKIYTTPIFKQPTHLSIWDYFLPTAYALSTTTPVGTGDGRVDGTGNADWDVIHNAATGGAAYATVDETNIVLTGKESGKYEIYRGFLPFDTSALPDDAVIATSTLFVWVSDKQDASSAGKIAVFEASQADPTTLATADYDAVQSTLGSSEYNITGGVTDDAWNGLVLNSEGRGWIDLTGWTKLSIREGHDYNDTANESAFDRVQIRFAEYSGTTYDPYLEISYTIGGGGTGTSTATSTDATGINEVTIGLLLGLVIIAIFDLLSRKTKNL